MTAITTSPAGETSATVALLVDSRIIPDDAPGAVYMTWAEFAFGPLYAAIRPKPQNALDALVAAFFFAERFGRRYAIEARERGDYDKLGRQRVHIEAAAALRAVTRAAAGKLRPEAHATLACWAWDAMAGVENSRLWREGKWVRA